ncbi:MAG: DUF4129 domain-containing protein [Streptosporangiaceae bacterium]
MVTTATVPALVLAAIHVGRGEAQRAARRELSKQLYHQDEPSLPARILLAIYHWVTDILQQVAAHSPGGWFGLLGLLALIVVIVVAVRLRLGPFTSARSTGRPVLDEAALSAAEHRAYAERLRAENRLDEAVREWMRALARSLEERAIVDPRPGRTAAELAGEAGAALPAYAAELRAGARVFDDVWYGGRPATAEDANRLGALDRHLRETRPALGQPARSAE